MRKSRTFTGPGRTRAPVQVHETVRPRARSETTARAGDCRLESSSVLMTSVGRYINTGGPRVATDTGQMSINRDNTAQLL